MKLRLTTVTVESLAAGGDGVGRVNGKTCFVPQSAPGDRLRIRIVKENKDFCRGEIDDILEPGPGRHKPDCPLVDTCGGCQWLHLDNATQLAAKTQILAHALQTDTVDFVPSPRSLGYRQIARLHFEPPHKDFPATLGFAKRKQRTIVNIDRCPILVSQLNDSIQPLGQLIEGMLSTRAEIRLAQGKSGTVIVIDTKAPLPPAFYTSAAGRVPEHFAGIAATIEGVTAEIAGKTAVELTNIDTKRFVAPATVFGQANAGTNQLLINTVASWVKKTSAKSAIELFAGAGNLTVAISPFVEKLATGEMDPDACRAAKENLAHRHMTHVEVRTGDAVAVYNSLDKKRELVVLDPPRTGNLELAEAMAKGQHRAIVYVSCNPATLARDLVPLTEAGYMVSRTCGFDMFPQTAHIEVAVLLER
jgi:23S rRNA (uracil1939-C5)-methyltransferase